VVVSAVGSQRAGAAAWYAKEWGIARSYDSYEELIGDADIDLVYNALPPSGHAEWSIAALEAGKDVLCEKPFAMNTIEARRMHAVAERTGKRLIEAFHDRYHPLSLELDEIKQTGRLGEIVSLAADFSGSNPFDPQSLRHDPALGGGALMDLGCYPVHWVRAFMGEEPVATEASATLNPLGADMSIRSSLLFPSGVTATVSASMESTLTASPFDIVGTRGSMHVENMIFPSRGHSIREEIAGVVRNSTVRGMETYDHQLAAIVAALASGEALPTESDDSIGNMAVIDSIYAAAGIERAITSA
jgi:predicted dehydrogenase